MGLYKITSNAPVTPSDVEAVIPDQPPGGGHRSRALEPFVTARTHPCPDCETGDCPCGSTCEGCDFTGDCSSCRGSGFVEGPAPRPTGWARPTRRSPRRPWGMKPPMDPCVGCDRARRNDNPYYRMTPEQVLCKVMESPGLRHRPRCVICCAPFGNMKSRWYQIAQSRSCVSSGSFEKIRL